MNTLSIALIILLGFTSLTLFVIVCLLGYYCYKFARIILVFEDDLSEAIDELFKCEEQLSKVLSLKLFFDSLEVRQEFQNVIDQIKLCRLSVVKMTERFVERSKQKYTVYEEPEEELWKSQMMLQQQQLQQQPEGEEMMSPSQTEFIFMKRNGSSRSTEGL